MPFITKQILAERNSFQTFSQRSFFSTAALAILNHPRMLKMFENSFGLVE